MTRDDAPEIGVYVGVAATFVCGFLVLVNGLGICPDGSANSFFFPYASAVGSGSALRGILGFALWIIQWPIYGLTFGAIVRERDPVSLPYALGVGFLVGHLALAAYLGS